MRFCDCWLVGLIGDKEMTDFIEQVRQEVKVAREHFAEFKWECAKCLVNFDVPWVTYQEWGKTHGSYELLGYPLYTLDRVLIGRVDSVTEIQRFLNHGFVIQTLTHVIYQEGVAMWNPNNDDDDVLLDEVHNWGSQTTLAQYEEQNHVILCDIWDEGLQLWILDDINQYCVSKLVKLARSKGYVVTKGTTREELLTCLEGSPRIFIDGDTIQRGYQIVQFYSTPEGWTYYSSKACENPREKFKTMRAAVRHYLFTHYNYLLNPSIQETAKLIRGYASL